ncbi:MAG: hypothetical protein JRH20_04360 [Deltaproteobacteria bacterium]|nr:hypothetical protein [Deltaproteobacteria bacterium]
MALRAQPPPNERPFMALEGCLAAAWPASKSVRASTVMTVVMVVMVVMVRMTAPWFVGVHRKKGTTGAHVSMVCDLESLARTPRSWQPLQSPPVG